MGHSMSLEMAPFDRLHISSYRRSTVTMALSCIISEIKRVTDWKSQFFHTPPSFDAPFRGSPSEYCHNVWYEKTSMVGYVYLFQYNARMWQTDRRTDIAWQHRPCYAQRRMAKKTTV